MIAAVVIVCDCFQLGCNRVKVREVSQTTTVLYSRTASKHRQSADKFRTTSEFLITVTLNSEQLSLFVAMVINA
jgi:hypothetical protein